MAKLSEAQKKAVPKSKRGLPSKSGTGSYPMPDKKHAAIAKAYAKRFATPAQQKQIDAKANAILGKKKSLAKKATGAKKQIKKAATMLKKKAGVSARSVK